MEKKRGMLESIGATLGFLGSVIAILQSGFVFAYAAGRGEFGRYGLVGLGVAILILVGAIIFYKGSTLLGAITMFFSSVIGQLTGGIIGFILIAIGLPLWPIFNESFLVSGYTIFSLVGSIFILVALWRDGRKKKLQ